MLKFYREVREDKCIVDGAGINFTKVKVTQWVGVRACQTIECQKNNISQGLTCNLSPEAKAQFKSDWEDSKINEKWGNSYPTSDE